MVLEKQETWLREKYVLIIARKTCIWLILPWKLSLKSFFWWYFSNYSRLLPNYIKVNCSLKFSNLQTVKTVSLTWLLTLKCLWWYLFSYENLSKRDYTTYKSLFRYKTIDKRQGQKTQNLSSNSKTEMHFSNERDFLLNDSIKLNSSQYYITYFFPLKESF